MEKRTKTKQVLTSLFVLFTLKREKQRTLSSLFCFVLLVREKADTTWLVWLVGLVQVCSDISVRALHQTKKCNSIKNKTCLSVQREKDGERHNSYLEIVNLRRGNRRAVC